VIATILLLAISSYQADATSFMNIYMQLGTAGEFSVKGGNHTAAPPSTTSVTSPTPPVSVMQPTTGATTSPTTRAMPVTPTTQAPSPTMESTSPSQSLTGPVMQVTDGSGRLGNNLAFMLRGILYAQMTQHVAVTFSLTSKSVKELFQPKAVVSLGGAKIEGPRFCPDKSDKRQEGRPVYNFQGERCKGSTAKDFHSLALDTLVQAFRPEFKTCLDAVPTPEEAAKELTVHLRGQDLWGMAEYELKSDKPIPLEANAHHWLWHQPPCTMYRKIIVEEGFKKVIVVTSPDLRHVCVEWLKSNAASLGIEVVIQSASLMEDFCALAKASNLVLSFSTLGDNAAVLNKQVKKIFFREFAQTHSLIDCGLWPGTELYQYKMDISEGKHPPYGNTYREVIKWFTTYDESQITKNKGGCR